jgi:hypothetical protein
MRHDPERLTTEGKMTLPRILTMLLLLSSVTATAFAMPPPRPGSSVIGGPAKNTSVLKGQPIMRRNHQLPG